MPDKLSARENVVDAFAELADKLSAHPIFLIVFNGLLIVLWFILGVEFANIFISIITAEIVLIGAGAARRSQLAIHAKLDEIIHAVGEAREDLVGVEHRAEADIKDLKLGD